jgi:hypothetical protein
MSATDTRNWPSSPAEWQEAVDAAEGALALDTARKYGLVTGGPEINVARCCEIKLKGLRMGIRPRPNAIENFVAASMKIPPLPV